MKGLKYILLSLSLSFCCIATYAQCPEEDPFCDDGGAPPDPWGDVPIDGGALALLAGGAALGYKALKKKKEDNTEKE